MARSKERRISKGTRGHIRRLKREGLREKAAEPWRQEQERKDWTKAVSAHLIREGHEGGYENLSQESIDAISQWRRIRMAWKNHQISDDVFDESTREFSEKHNGVLDDPATKEALGYISKRTEMILGIPIKG